MTSWFPWLQRLWRWIAGLIGLAALLLALGIGAFRLAIELLPGYQERIVDRVRETTGLALEFDSVYARIGRYGPEVVFRGARVLPDAGGAPLVTAESGRVSISIPRTIWFRRLEVARVVFVRPRLQFEISPGGSIRLVGQAALHRPESPRTPMTLDRLPRGRFAVTDAVLDVEDLRARQGRFQLTGADLDVLREGNEIRLTGRVDLPDQLGSYIDIAGEAGGDLADPSAVDWRARIEARDLDLGQWSSLLPESFRVPAAGRGSIRVAARGRGRDLRSLRVQPDLRDFRAAGSRQAFTRIAGDIRLQRDDTNLSVEAAGLELSRPGAPWRPGDFAASLTFRNGRIASASARAGYLRIENLAALADVLPPGPMRERIAALAPRGEIFGLDVTVGDAGNRTLPDVRGRLRFENLGISPSGKVAGFSGFDGSVEGGGGGGVVRIATRDATIDWPQQWRAPATVRSADARLEWQRFGNGVRLWLDDAVADSGHGIARGKVRMLLRPGEVPIMDVSATASDVDVTQLWRYLPVRKMSPKAVKWVDAAFRGGRVTRAAVTITGPTLGFPYREGQGEFRATGHASGIDLFYFAGWPDLEGVEADFEFDGPALHAVASQGSIGGVPFTDGEVQSGDLRDAIFAARGRSDADAGSVIAMLQSTPLAPSFGAVFADLAGAGPVQAEAVLVLPVKAFDKRVVTVRAALGGVSLRQRSRPWQLTDVTGEVWIRNREVVAPSLAGRALGGRWQASIATTLLAAGDLRTVVTGQGTLQGAALQPLAHLPRNAGVSGATGWRGSLDLVRNSDPKVPARGTVQLTSDLRGLASSLPPPFDKPAESARPIVLAASFDGTGGPRIEGALGSDVRALLRWRGKPGGVPIERGIIAFGGDTPRALPPGDGLWLTGHLARASLTKVLDLEWDEPRIRPVQDWIAGADLAVDRAEGLGYEFSNVGVRLRPGRGAWDVAIDGDAIDGRASVPYDFPGDVPMVIDLDRLHLGDRASNPGSRPDPDPRKLPAIHASIRDFVATGRDFGAVEAEFTRGTAGLTLNRFTMTHPAFTAEGRGSWLVSGGAANCSLDFEAETTDVKAFMEAMLLGSQVEGAKGHLSAQLTWPGPPEQSAFERLSGRLAISASDGELTSVEPGAGRVFGLMSLAHLKRRLALDFKDLTGPGLSFDTLTGTFRLTDGDIYTDDLTLRGSAAEIGIAGHTNLKTRTYDQTAIVTGQLGASLGVAGAIAGGPVVGAALLLFSQVFKGALQGVTRGYYRITGSWDDPQVKRIEARELKDEREETPGNP